MRQLVNACTGCRFPHDLHGRDLHGLRFVGADLRDVDFSHANLSGAQFTGADLQNARFDDADLRNARFAGVRFGNTSFARANTAGIVMEGVRLDARSIVGADYRTFRALQRLRSERLGRRATTASRRAVVSPPDRRAAGCARCRARLRERIRPAIPPDIGAPAARRARRAPAHNSARPRAQTARAWRCTCPQCRRCPRCR